jgi:hypothetical protein
MKKFLAVLFLGAFLVASIGAVGCGGDDKKKDDKKKTDDKAKTDKTTSVLVIKHIA